MANLHPDAKLTELGRQFEAAKKRASKFNAACNDKFAEYEAAKATLNLSDLPRDQSPEQRALERQIYRDCGYKAANAAFNEVHGECIRLMKSIHRAKATTLEGFAVKVAAIAFDQGDFELDPTPTDVAEVQLYRLARDMAKAVKAGGRANG